MREGGADYKKMGSVPEAYQIPIVLDSIPNAIDTRDSIHLQAFVFMTQTTSSVIFHPHSYNVTKKMQVLFRLPPTLPTLL